MDLLQGYGDDDNSEQTQNTKLKPVLLKSKINSAPDVDITNPVSFCLIVMNIQFEKQYTNVGQNTIYANNTYDEMSAAVQVFRIIKYNYDRVQQNQDIMQQNNYQKILSMVIFKYKFI